MRGWRAAALVAALPFAMAHAAEPAAPAAAAGSGVPAEPAPSAAPAPPAESAPSGEPALTAEQDATIRCIVAVSALAAGPDPAAAALAKLAGTYWLGRLGAFDEAAVERKVVDLALKATETDIKLDLERCGAEMKLRGDAMQRIGQGLQRRAANVDTH